MSKSSHGDSQAPAQNPSVVAARATHAPITDRVNADPAIFNGMTSAEGSRIALACLSVYGLLGLAAGLLTRIWPLALVLALLGSGATLWYASLYLAQVKRGRPEGYYVQAIHLWLAGKKLTATQFLQRLGYWGVGRPMPFNDYSSPLAVHGRRRPTPQRTTGRTTPRLRAAASN